MEGPDPELDWFVTDEEFGQYVLDMGKMFGSTDLASTCIRLGLIDEYRLLINPVVVGRGHPLFKNADRTRLKLLEARPFRSGPPPRPEEMARTALPGRERFDRAAFFAPRRFAGASVLTPCTLPTRPVLPRAVASTRAPRHPPAGR
jgi:hypothetical protein